MKKVQELGISWGQRVRGAPAVAFPPNASCAGTAAPEKCPEDLLGVCDTQKKHGKCVSAPEVHVNAVYGHHETLLHR